MMRISRPIEQLHIPDPELIDIGWTKVEVIAPYLTKTNWQPLIKLAREHTVSDWRAASQSRAPAGSCRTSNPNGTRTSSTAASQPLPVRF